jgi:hypothetical protein
MPGLLRNVSHGYRAHCGHVFAFAVLRQTHQTRCHLCRRIGTIEEEMIFQDRSRRELEDSPTESLTSEVAYDDGGNADDDVTGLLFLENPQQRRLLAELLLSYEPTEHMSGLSYFEPASPPPYFRYNGKVLPPFTECQLKPSCQRLHIGYVREDQHTIVDTWFFVDTSQNPIIDFRYRENVCTGFEDTEVHHGGLTLTLMPIQALDIIFSAFKKRYRMVLTELHRVNQARLEAYQSA